MNHFTIKDIENLSGIKAHTLRIWEQRYNFNFSRRKDSNHRFYTNDDLKLILRIAHLYHNGYRVSKIADLSQDEITRLTNMPASNADHNVPINMLIEACLDYDTEKFEKTLDITAATLGMEKAMTQVIYPFMQKIGLLWVTSHIIPAQEHFSSALIRKKLLVAINALDKPAGQKKSRVVLFTPAGEFHELPVLFIQYLLKKNGCRAVLLGHNINIDTLSYYCGHQPATHLWFHLITNFTGKQAIDLLEQYTTAFPEKKIIASGPAINVLTGIPANAEVLASLDAMIVKSRNIA